MSAQTNDWMGATIIRNVPRTRSTGSGAVHYARDQELKLERIPRKMNVCVVPDCKATLSNKNFTKVCKMHLHGRHCACGQCTARSGK